MTWTWWTVANSQARKRQRLVCGPIDHPAVRQYDVLAHAKSYTRAAAP